MSIKMSTAKKKRIYDRYSGICTICGIKLTLDINRCYDNDYMQIDHIVPRHLGGSNKEENLRPLCRSCNSRRKGTSGDELLSIYERELRDFITWRTERTIYYVDSAKFKAITKDHFKQIEMLILKRRQLEDELLAEIRNAPETKL